jgi:hypothetical protein
MGGYEWLEEYREPPEIEVKHFRRLFQFIGDG